ncbi:MAG TPA: UMP kinase [Candidatus Woesearchaeota archaeon]|jgi:uridylate kinase|nr:UMP kinase [Candidatus Woesearchaeota archaeon]HJN56547.1 UMP kinase [Candidatus Woesearchaeota archaeon]|tara:strand:- start:33149 stop:33835 length:687 start_codon:yes stop_codon:yes gene_type:complete
MKKTIIISLGGSLIVPEDVDSKFLRNFKKIIEKYIKKGYKFVVFCGGGKTARNYQKAVSEIVKSDNVSLDWIGIKATEINALLIKTIFSKNSEDEIIKNPLKKIKFRNKILIAAGWKPGWSTDYDAVLLAKNLKIKTIVNMSNIDYVYNKDPRKYKDAKKIKNIEWKKYRKISGNKWKAGLNLPFDPVASKEAEKSKVNVFIIGKNLKNFEDLLNGGDFKGTVIKCKP